MKGFISAIGGTIIVMLAALFVILIGTLSFIGVQFEAFVGGGPATSSVEYVAQSNNAQILATVLSNAITGDRSFLEHSTEIAQSSVNNASSERLPGYLQGFSSDFTLGSFGSKNYIAVEIDKEDNVPFYYNNLDKKCGNNLNGFCVPLRICGAGREEIDKADYARNLCRPNEKCCVEDSNNGVYRADVRRCGPAGSKTGVCDMSVGGTCAPGTLVDQKVGVCKNVNAYCLPGRIKIEAEEGDCSLGTVCCYPLSNGNKPPGFSATTEIPVIYKDTLGIVKVTSG